MPTNKYKTYSCSQVPRVPCWAPSVLHKYKSQPTEGGLRQEEQDITVQRGQTWCHSSAWHTARPWGAHAAVLRKILLQLSFISTYLNQIRSREITCENDTMHRLLRLPICYLLLQLSRMALTQLLNKFPRSAIRNAWYISRPDIYPQLKVDAVDQAEAKSESSSLLWKTRQVALT